MSIEEAKKGIKFDADKFRWSLVPWESMAPVLRVLEHGAKKYSPDNWKRVPNARLRYENAIQRHLLGDGKNSKGYLRGEKLDPETGENHLGHIIASALFLIYFDQNPDKEPK